MTGNLTPSLRRIYPKAELDLRLESCVLKYKRLRRAVREALEEEALRRLGLKVEVCPIDDKSLKEIEQSWGPMGRRVSFKWAEHIRPRLLKSHPRRLDLSFWVGSCLCGVAAMRLSDSKEWLSITHVEASPDNSHFLKSKIVPLTLLGADIYSKVVQNEDAEKRCPKVRLLNPLKEAISWYERLGYSELTVMNGYSFLTFSEGQKS